MPTIRDVAKKAGVATSTVSAVLNNKGYVHAETRSRVESVITELKYIPRRSARNLTTKTSGNIGFIVNERHFTRSEPFYTKVFLGTEFQARRSDLYVLLTSVEDDYKSYRDMPRFLLERNVDGVIVAGSVPVGLLEDLKERNIPVVLVDFGYSDFQFPMVLIDNQRGMLEATRHLLELGHQDIGFVGGNSRHLSCKERLEGVKQALAENSLQFDEKWLVTVNERSSVDVGERVFNELWKQETKPTAIVCFNDATAIGALRAAQAKGIRIPEDLSILGFDNVEAGAHTSPPLTTVHVIKEDLGVSAMKTMLDLINNSTSLPASTRISVELILRDSTGPAPKY